MKGQRKRVALDGGGSVQPRRGAGRARWLTIDVPPALWPMSMTRWGRRHLANKAPMLSRTHAMVSSWSISPGPTLPVCPTYQPVEKAHRAQPVIYCHDYRARRIDDRARVIHDAALQAAR